MADRPLDPPHGSVPPSPDGGSTSSPSSAATPPAAPAEPIPAAVAPPAGVPCPRCSELITPGVPHSCAAAMAPTEAVSLAAMAATASQPVSPVGRAAAPMKSGERPAIVINPGAFVANTGEDLTGSIISERYQVITRLTQGGMGVVYQARHMMLDSVVAIKVLLRAEESDQQRFMREARLASKINHPNTVYISDFGILPDGRTYLVMEYLSGRTLGSLLLGGRRFDPLRACRIAVQIARGLQAVHDKGIVHRDLKPDNIFLLEQDGKPDFVKIVDFGIAKATERGEAVQLAGADVETSQPLSLTAMQELAEAEPVTDRASQNITRAGTVMGTPGYMAPEQIQGFQQDARVDQYALGCLLFEMLVGEPVFVAGGPVALMMKHASDPVPSVQRRLAAAMAHGPHAQLDAPAAAPGGSAQVPDSLDRLVDRLLSKDATARFASMTELAEALEREIDLMLVQRGERTVVPTGLVGAISQPPASLPPPAATPASGPNFVTLGLVMVGALLVTALGLGGLVMMRGRGKGAADRAATQRLRVDELQAMRSAATGVLLRGLQGPPQDPARVVAALLALGRSRDGAQRGRLEAALADPSEGGAVAQAAAEALGSLGDRAALAAVRAALTQTSPAGGAAQPQGALLRVTLAGTLRKLGDPDAAQMLRDALTDSDVAVRLRAALSLCSTDPPQVRDALLAAVALPSLPPSLLLDALQCLARLGDAPARARLGELSQTGAGESQIAALGRLAALGDVPARQRLQAMAQKRTAEGLVAAHALAGLEDDGVLPLLREISGDTQAGAAARQLALEGLGAVGEATDARQLAGQLVGADAAAAIEPGQQQLAAAVVQIVARQPALLSGVSVGWARGALSDRSWTAREAAAAVLGDTVAPDAVQLLAKLLQDGDAKVRVAAARALGRRPEPEALLALRAGLADPDGDVRREVLRAIERLVGALSLVRRGQVGPVAVADVVAMLRPLFDRGTPVEQISAGALLVRLADRQSAEKLRGFRTADDAVLRRLYFDRVATDRDELLSGLKDAAFAVRLAAAGRLVELHAEEGQRHAVPILQEAVRAGGADAIAAFALLSRMGEKSDAPPDLERAIAAGTAPQRMAAIEALARLPSKQAVPLLLHAAHDPEALVRRLVAEVAADLGDAGREGRAASAGGASGDATAPGVPVLRVLVGDADAAVRARAEALLGRLLQQAGGGDREAAIAELLQPSADLSTPRAAGATAGPTGAGGADGGAGTGQAGTAPSAGGTADGKSDGKGDGKTDKGVARLTKPPAAEALLRGGLDALAKGDAKTAQRLLEKANALCSRDGKHGSECAVLMVEASGRLGALYEAQKLWPEAMAEYQKVLASGARGKAEIRGGAQAGASRLAPRLGQVVVRSAGKAGGKGGAVCQEHTMWMRPGAALIKVDGKLEPIEVRAQSVLRVGTCPASGARP